MWINKKGNWVIENIGLKGCRNYTVVMVVKTTRNVFDDRGVSNFV